MRLFVDVYFPPHTKGQIKDGRNPSSISSSNWDYNWHIVHNSHRKLLLDGTGGVKLPL